MNKSRKTKQIHMKNKTGTKQALYALIVCEPCANSVSPMHDKCVILLQLIGNSFCNYVILKRSVHHKSDTCMVLYAWNSHV